MNFKSLGKMHFPEAHLDSINMMPFIMNDPESLPISLRRYWRIIDECGVTLRNTIGFLTIRECFLPAFVTQSRQGIHTEGYGITNWGNGGSTAWGKGDYQNSKGVFMASTVANTTEVWDKYIHQPGKYGKCLDLDLGRGYKLAENELVWMTDRTPHRVLAVDRPIFRQFFRLVTEDVSVWFALHSDKNPLGVKPDPNITRISYEKKF